MYTYLCGKMYSRAGHEASQPATFFLSFFFLGEEKKIIIRKNILKKVKKGTL